METQRPFGLRDKISYMAGDIANDLSFMMSAFFLMVYYTNVLNIEGYVVGLLFLCARFLDAFTDIGMGQLLDRIKPFKEGRFRGMIKRTSPFVCIAGFLLFLHIVKDWDYPFKLAYVIVTYVLWGSFAYTAVNIPYGSMAAVITAKPEERASLSVFRSMGANIALLFINFVVPLIIYKSIDGKEVIMPERFTMLMAVFMIVAFILYQFCWRTTVERIETPPKTNQPFDKKHIWTEIKAILTSLASNKSLLIFILIAIILLLATLLMGAMNPYLYPEYFKNKVGLSIGGMLPVAAVFLLAPFAGNIVKKFGKKESAAVGMLFSSIVFFLIFSLKITNLWVFLVLIFIGSLGLYYFNVIIWAFITDIIDNQYIKTNQREDGTIYAVYSFARKIGQALAGGLGGFALSYIGYNSKLPEQSQETLNQIYNLATIVPAVACAAIFILLSFFFPLSKKVIAENIAEMEKRSQQSH